MSLMRTLRLVGGNQKRNLLRVFRGQPLMTPSLGSMTLDTDDVALAKQWLKQPVRWFESEIVDRYEKEFALWNGSKHAFAFMGGRVALSAIISALGLKAGDEVIIPGYTCIVVPNAFQYEGIKVRYADIELETYGPDIDSIKKCLSGKTKAILIHHLFGLVCRDFEKIIDLARSEKIFLIEDCAHAAGAVYKNRKVGNFGDAAFYSSEQSKVFNTIQGGLAVTNNDEIAGRLKEFSANAAWPAADWIDKQLTNVLLNYYQAKHPRRWITGDLAELKYGKKRLISTTAEEMRGVKPSYYGMKMPAPVAALGLNQLKKIDRYNLLRCENSKKWAAWCDEKKYRKPFVIPDSKPVFLRYPVLVEEEKKTNLDWAAKELGVAPGVWFVSNLHPTPGVLEDCPNANIAVKQCINFPCLGLGA